MTDEQAMAPAAPQEEKAEPAKKINRREFLNLAWLASLGILSIDLGVVTYFFALPRFREGEFGGTFTIGDKSGLPAVGASPDENPKGKFWLSNTAAGVLALYKVCTHLGCLYGWIEEEGIFRCPCHGSQFEQNGQYKAGPAPRSLDRFVVQVVDQASGEVVAETDLLTGDALPVPDNPDYILRVDTGNLVRGLPK